MLKLKLDLSADSRYGFDRKRVRKALLKTLSENSSLDGVVLVSMSVVGERKIRELEQKFFNRDEVTDVLSFPQEVINESENVNGEHLLGDIVICYPQAKRQAMQWNRLIDEEIEFLACHGLLHLLGIHHD